MYNQPTVLATTDAMSTNPLFFKRTLTVASLFALRMLGLFMFIPIFSLYASKLSEATPLLVGVAFGIYGLSQALFQIPLGLLSDRIGRKPVLLGGFAIFALASLAGAHSHNIYVMIAARFLQGSAAIGSTLIALVSDLTDEEHRARSMAIIGMSIGPMVAQHFHLNGVFTLSAILALIALFIVQTKVAFIKQKESEKPTLRDISTLLREKNLILFDLGIFIQHAIFTASFFALPLLLKNTIQHQWQLYLPILVTSFLIAYPLITLYEKKGRLKSLYLFAIAITVVAQWALWHHHQSLTLLGLSLFFFFLAFNVLEATLPASVSKVAPQNQRGTAMGIYSSSQFLGIFFGGLVAGQIANMASLQAIFLFNALLALGWLLASQSIDIPSKRKLTTVEDEVYTSSPSS